MTPGEARKDRPFFCTTDEELERYHHAYLNHPALDKSQREVVAMIAREITLREFEAKFTRMAH